MITDFEARLKAVNDTALTPLVRQVLADQGAEVLGWDIQPVTGGAAQERGGSFGIYRFSGRARQGDAVHDWSLILKAMGGDVTAANTVATADPADADYWKREILINQSGMLTDLPGGLVAARCYDVVEYPRSQEYWLWLEDVTDTDWTLETYGQAARHLGQFNGAYLNGLPIPQADWLSTGRIRRWMYLGEDGLGDIEQLSQHLLNKQWLGDDGVARILRLSAQRERLLAALARLPRTFCHHDAFRRNLMFRHNSAGQAETVAIDWAKTGSGAVGEETATMVAMSVLFFEVEATQFKELEANVLSGYVEGLRDAGWHSDARLVRFGYAATASLSVGLGVAGILLTRSPTTESAQFVETVIGQPYDAFLRETAITLRHIFDLGDEALALLDTLATDGQL